MDDKLKSLYNSIQTKFKSNRIFITIIVILCIVLFSFIWLRSYFSEPRGQGGSNNVNQRVEQLEDRIQSAVSQQELIKLQNQLLESKKVINELETNYRSAKNNLQELKNDLRESKILLTQLKLDIKQLQQENNRLRAQRDTYAYGGAVLLVASIAAWANK